MITLSPPKGYEIERVLGSGSSATVYLAVDLKLNRRVALKCLATQQLAPNEVNLIRAEGQTLASVTGSHVARVYDIATTREAIWLVLEYIPGPTLQDVLDKTSSQIPLQHAIHFCAQIADALVSLAKAGVVHQDLKPGNIVISDMRECRLVDFGAAWSEEAIGHDQNPRSSDGTPAFMAPEQVRDQPATPKTDVYSLGVTAYWLLTGVHPFAKASGDAGEMMAAQLCEVPTPIRRLSPDVPANVAAAVKSALRKRPRRRPSATRFRSQMIAGLP